jgi:hypothetical protein
VAVGYPFLLTLIKQKATFLGKATQQTGTVEVQPITVYLEITHTC